MKGEANGGVVTSNGQLNSQSQNGNQSLPGPQKDQQLLQIQLQVKGKPNKKYDFAVTSEEILNKYSKYPPSLTFHIYETHYKFNNQDSNIIPKSSPMVKDFLIHMLKEEIPVEMSELIKDFSVRSYDGCLILQVYDHRHMVSSGTDSSNSGSKAANDSVSSSGNNDSNKGSLQESNEKTVDSNGNNNTTSNTTTTTTTTTATTSSSGSNTSSSASSSVKPVVKPKTYRTILRPTQLSLYHDLLYHTDSALTRFTDPLSLQMESEILNLTNRKLDLNVPLNPYHQESYLFPDEEYPKKVWNDEKQDYELIHLHRPEVEKPQRNLHQDEVLHKSSEYEEIMFLLSNKYKKTEDLDKRLMVVGNSSSIGTSGANNSAPAVTSSGLGTPGSPSKSKEGSLVPDFKNRKPEGTISSIGGGSTSNVSTAGQFMRLRYIEDIRKRKEAQKAHKDATVAMKFQGNSIDTINQTNTINGQSPEKLINNRPPSQPNLNQPMANQAMTNQAMTNPSMANQPIPQPNSTNPTPQQREMFQKAQAIRAQQLQNQQQQQQQFRLQQQRQQQQQQPQQNQQMQQAQQAQQQQFKRQRMSPQVQQMQQMQSSRPYQSPQLGHSQPNSQMGTPVMGVNMPNQRVQQLQQQMPVSNQQAPPDSQSQFHQSQGQPSRPMTAPGGQVQNPQAARLNMQQQQQQIFQSTLTPQEQQVFRQLQGRMNAFAVMGNTGVAPNRTQLNPQQQQQAMQQAKLIQQQLLQKFPVYFQRLRQFQLLQQQRQKQQQQQQQRQQQNQMPSQTQFSPQMGSLNMDGN